MRRFGKCCRRVADREGGHRPGDGAVRRGVLFLLEQLKVVAVDIHEVGCVAADIYAGLKRDSSLACLL